MEKAAVFCQADGFPLVGVSHSALSCDATSQEGKPVLVGQFSYKFEELPLLVVGSRLVAGLVDGSAMIEFTDPGGNWKVSRIWIEAAYLPMIGEKGRVELVELDNSNDLQGAIRMLVQTALLMRDEEDIAAAVLNALQTGARA
jgi:hypothetical protein